MDKRKTKLIFVGGKTNFLVFFKALFAEMHETERIYLALEQW